MIRFHNYERKGSFSPKKIVKENNTQTLLFILNRICPKRILKCNIQVLVIRYVGTSKILIGVNYFISGQPYK